MKLYYSPGACSLSSHILLCLSGLNFEVERVDLRSKKTETGADFLKINPRGQVPTLVLYDGTVLLENIAIAQYIADKTQNPVLLEPVGSVARYQTLSWFSYVGTDLHKAFGPLFHSTDPQVKSDTITALNSKFAYINDHLKQRSFVATDSFSIADAYLYVVLCWRKIIQDLPAYPEIDRYSSNIEKMTAVQNARASESN